MSVFAPNLFISSRNARLESVTNDTKDAQANRLYAEIMMAMPCPLLTGTADIVLPDLVVMGDESGITSSSAASLNNSQMIGCKRIPSYVVD